MNINKIKGMVGIILPQLFTTLAFFISFVFYGIWVAAIVFLCSLIVFTLVGRLFTANAFRDLMEGMGILALDITSTGIIRPFIVGMQSGRPYLTGKVNGNKVKGMFNRQAVTQLSAPLNISAGNEFSITEDKAGKTKLYCNIDIETYNSSRFQLNSFPTLIYNSQIDSILTKDFLSEQEKSVFAEHTLLFLNQKLDELTTLVRDFGRGVVESLKPSFNPMTSWIVWAIVGIGIIVLGVLFGPAVLDTLSSAGGASVDAFGATSSAITPIVK